MYAVDNIVANAKQKQTLVLPGGDLIDFSMFYVSAQLGWYIRELKYINFVLNGMRITNSPNMLHQYRNQIPFGIACFSDQNREPTQQKDFLSGASKIYILTADEVATYAGILSGEVQS